jgi:nucleoporin NUP159
MVRCFNILFYCFSDAHISVVSSIGWLENDVFFMVYTPNVPEDDMGIPASFYYIITRRKQAPFLIQQFPEICSTMGFMMKRSPAYQFIVRLRDFKPHMKDVLMVASTASAEIGLIVRSDKELGTNAAGQFAVAIVNDDIKRASVPLTDSGDDTSVIGLAPNLSSRENVLAPIMGEDIQESSTPLPALLLLNNDGILCSWWFIYTESIRQNVPYPGLVSASQPSQMPSQPTVASSEPAAAAPAQQQPAFGQPSFGTPSPFGASGFGKPSGGATFGSPSTMGATAFGKPSAPSFGSPSGLGGNAAPAFGKPSFGTPGQPAQFGKSGFGAASSPSPFGQPSTPAKSLLGTGTGASGGGFSSFSGAAGGGGFAGFAAAKPAESPFAKASGDNAFAKASPFGAKPSGDAAFPPAQTTEVKNPFGSGAKSGFGSAGGFVLGSSFKGDGTAANDLPKPEKPSSGALSFGGFGESMSLSNKPSTPAESMDDSEDIPAAEPAKSEPVSLFGLPNKPAAPGPSLFGAQTTQPAKSPPLETTKSSSGFSMFGTSSAATPQSPFQPSSQTLVTSPLSAPSDVTATPKKEPSVTTPTFSSLEAPLPPDSTSRASYAPGDTSASSNVSKSSVEDAPLPPDFVSEKKPSARFDDAPLPPDFTTKQKALPEAEDAPLPPDFMTKPIKAESPSPGIPEAVPEEAPLPPDPITSKAKVMPAEEAVPIPEGSDAESQDADESDFSDSGEEITHDETKIPSPKVSVGTSFGGLSDKSSTSGFFSGFSKAAPKEETSQRPRQLFGEISKQPVLPPPGPAIRSGREPFRSPSPTRINPQKSTLFSRKPEGRPAGSALASRKASLTQIAQREGHLRKPSDAARQERAHAEAAALRRAEEEVLALADDDEDEKLREDLARPVEPVATLDPFLPHQNYTGDTVKPGIPGMIERLYRDINSMVDTLGINARSLESFLQFQQSADSSDADKWVHILKSDDPANVLDEDIFLQDIDNLEDVVAALFEYLEEQRLQGVEQKLKDSRELATDNIVKLRIQFASIRKTLDALSDTGVILSAPLSAEQATLQHDLRTMFTNLQAKMAELEQGVSMLRAKMAETPRPNGAGSSSRKPPTMGAVTSTIDTLMGMAESKSSEVDVLEAELRKLGVDTSSSRPASREGSPFTTPRKNVGRFPATPGSRGSIDGSAYHTPESASRGVNFRASINGSAKHSRLRSVDVAGPITSREDTNQWKANAQRRKHLVASLKGAIEKKEKKVRGVDEF